MATNLNAKQAFKARMRDLRSNSPRAFVAWQAGHDTPTSGLTLAEVEQLNPAVMVRFQRDPLATRQPGRILAAQHSARSEFGAIFSGRAVDWLATE